MHRLGVIPAAGKAERFGGILKELLPLRDGRSFLRHAVDRLPLDNVVIVTTPDKIQAHAREIPEALFVIQQGEGLWGAILESIKLGADYYYLTMPDTYMSPMWFDDCDFSLGVFETDKPGRFGVLRDGLVVDKKPGSVPCKAWGALTWSRKAVTLWHEHKPESHTHAINLAIQQFGLKTWSINRYHDNASMLDYMGFLS